MENRKLTVVFALLCSVGASARQLCADVTAVPLTSAQIGQDPYKFNGVIIADLHSGGSGAVVRHTNIVLSCAHVVYSGEGLLDPWLGDVRWFWKYHASAQPSWDRGKLLRGYVKFTSYQSAAETSGMESAAAFAWDAVAHYAYESLAGGDSGRGWDDGPAALRGSGSKMVTGYPSGLYPWGHPDEYKMHVAGPFSTAFRVERGAYLAADGVAVGAGTSGGPVWVQDTSGTWQVAGVLVSTIAKALAGPINSIGVRALDADAWALVNEAMGAAPPPNDSFATGTVISGFPSTLTAANTGATRESNEPDHADETGGKSVWWSWTAPSTGTVTVDTIGSSFDTLLAVYTGNAVTNLTLVASDDGSGGADTSAVTFTALQGTAYSIVVDGYYSASGRIVLNLTSPPANDDFAARAVVTGSSVSVTGSNVSGSKETAEPNHAGLSGGKSVWWTWIMPTDGTVTVDTTGSGFDTLLAVYTGSSMSALTAVAGDNDSGGNGASRLTFSGTAGTAYQIAVDGFRGEQGRMVLSLRQGIQITRQPQSRSVVAGGSAIFSISTAGTTSPTYQWRKDGADLGGATNSTYAVANVQTAHAGAYSVSVKDAFGGAESAQAVLTVTGPYTFVTLAGWPLYGSANGTGDAGRFFAPRAVTVDRFGNLFVADTGNHTIRKITPGGVATTLAGSAGNIGGGDGAGSAARFAYPMGVAVDSAGRIYVADYGNHTIRRITPGGTVSTLAGSTAGFSGSADGTGTAARFGFPSGVAVDAAGNVYAADTGNHTIRKITAAGVVSTLAGSALKRGSGDGMGSGSRFAFPQGVAVDNAGNVLVADSGNDTIRKITPDGMVSTLAGLAGNSGSADGAGSAALFTNPIGITVDAAGNVYVAENYRHTIRKITPAGVVTTLAGMAGVSGSADGTGSAARFNQPSGLTRDDSGQLYLADTGNNIIRKITPDGAVSTLAGKASIGIADGMGSAASFTGPDGMAVDNAGNLYVADISNHTIRKITPSGEVSTLAGLARDPGSADGTRSEARFNHPESVAVDRAGNVYVPDSWNHTIRKITPDGVVSTLAGLAGAYGSVDGVGSAARFFYPFAVAVDAVGQLFVADGYNHTIRKITAEGTVTTLAGGAGSFGHADGPGNTARFHSPESVAVAEDGNVYVADYGNHVIRKISAEGLVSTLAGIPGVSGSADGSGSEARFNGPTGVAVDGAGNVYVSERGNNTIRMISPDGVVSTLAGSAKDLPGSRDGRGATAQFNHPWGVAVDSIGNVYVADSGNNTIRKGWRFAIITQPQNATVIGGSSAEFKVAASGSPPLGYQWRLNGVDLDGATNSALVLTNVPASQAGRYSVTVASAGSTLTSADAVLTVTTDGINLPKAEQTISFGPVGDKTFGDAPFALNAASSSGLPVSLEILSGPATVSGNSITLTGTGVVAVRASQAGNAGYHAAPSVDQSFTVAPASQPPTAKLSVAAITVAGGQSQELEIRYSDDKAIRLSTLDSSDVRVRGPNGFDQLAALDYLDIGGDGTPRIGYYHIKAPGGVWDSADNGVYTVLMESNQVSDTSNEFVAAGVLGTFDVNVPIPLTVTAPAITTQPQSQTVIAGTNVTFKVSATGSDPLAYQWHFNGSPIPGATTAELTLTNVQTSSAGEYAVAVTNVVGQAVSAAAKLTVVVRPPNDDFTTRIQLVGSSIAAEGSNVNASQEAGEPNHAGKPATRSVWWSWTAPESGAVTISTSGSGIDTLLGVYTGATLASLVPVASNDDDPDGGSTSRVTFRAEAGTEYQIAVDAFGGEAGSIKLSLMLEIPRASLRVELSGKNLVLSWPAQATGFVLEATDDLATPVWTQASVTPVMVGETFSVKVPISGGSKVFRLRRP